MRYYRRQHSLCLNRAMMALHDAKLNDHDARRLAELALQTAQQFRRLSRCKEAMEREVQAAVEEAEARKLRPFAPSDCEEAAKPMTIREAEAAMGRQLTHAEVVRWVKDERDAKYPGGGPKRAGKFLFDDRLDL